MHYAAVISSQTVQALCVVYTSIYTDKYMYTQCVSLSGLMIHIVIHMVLA